MSTTIAFFLYELATHSDVQERLRKEIIEVTERHGGLSYEALSEMKYMDMCLTGKFVRVSYRISRIHRKGLFRKLIHQERKKTRISSYITSAMQSIRSSAWIDGGKTTIWEFGNSLR